MPNFLEFKASAAYATLEASDHCSIVYSKVIHNSCFPCIRVRPIELLITANEIKNYVPYKQSNVRRRIE